MSNFKDGEDRAWILKIDGASHEAIRAATGVSVFSVVDEECDDFWRLRSDFDLYCQCLWVLCKGQHEIDYEEFRAGIYGDVLTSALNAWHEAVLAFLPALKATKYLMVMDAIKNEGQTKQTLDKLAVALEQIEQYRQSASSIGTPGSAESTLQT